MSTKKFSEYVPRICCAHHWIAANLVDWHEMCADCGATCTRDQRGKIVTYSAHDEPRYQHAGGR